MKQLVHTVALGAALVALALGIWRDYGTFMAIKRAGISYLVAYFLAGGLGIAARAALSAIRDPEPEPVPEEKPVKKRRRRRGPPKDPAPETAPPEANENPAPQPEPVEVG